MRFSCQLQAAQVCDILLATRYQTFSKHKPLLNKLLQTKIFIILFMSPILVV